VCNGGEGGHRLLGHTAVWVLASMSASWIFLPPHVCMYVKRLTHLLPAAEAYIITSL